MKQNLLLVLIICTMPASFFAQSIFKHLELNVGCGVQKQDRRLYDFGYSSMIIAHEDSYYDHQYDININATIWSKSIWNVALGAGYSLYESKFSRPFDAHYFGDGSQVLHRVGNYVLHNLSFINTNKIILNAEMDKALSFVFPIRTDFTFNKHVSTNDHFERFNKFIFEFDKVEIYIGLHGKLNRFTTCLLWRVYNYQKIDRVLFNHLIFHSSHPSFLEQEYEAINFYKLMVNVGYVF